MCFRLLCVNSFSISTESSSGPEASFLLDLLIVFFNSIIVGGDIYRNLALAWFCVWGCVSSCRYLGVPSVCVRGIERLLLGFLLGGLLRRVSFSLRRVWVGILF